MGVHARAGAQGRQDTCSGGCVKLVHDDAVAWFAYLQVGDQVQVH